MPSAVSSAPPPTTVTSERLSFASIVSEGTEKVTVQPANGARL